jgi:hypothetical protein
MLSDTKKQFITTINTILLFMPNGNFMDQDIKKKTD